MEWTAAQRPASPTFAWGQPLIVIQRVSRGLLHLAALAPSDMAGNQWTCRTIGSCSNGYRENSFSISFFSWHLPGRLFFALFPEISRWLYANFFLFGAQEKHCGFVGRVVTNFVSTSVFFMKHYGRALRGWVIDRQFAWRHPTRAPRRNPIRGRSNRKTIDHYV